VIATGRVVPATSLVPSRRPLRDSAMLAGRRRETPNTSPGISGDPAGQPMTAASSETPMCGRIPRVVSME
jgi:hypothetical protein